MVFKCELMRMKQVTLKTPNGMLRKTFKKGDKINVKVKSISKKKIKLIWMGK